MSSIAREMELRVRYGLDTCRDVGGTPPLISAADLELVCIHHRGEDTVDVDIAIGRAEDMGANLGISHAEWLQLHHAQCSPAVRNVDVCLIFLGTMMYDVGHHTFHFPYLMSRGDRWEILFWPQSSPLPRRFYFVRLRRKGFLHGVWRFFGKG